MSEVQIKPEQKPQEPTMTQQELSNIMNNIMRIVISMSLEVLDHNCNCVFYQYARELAKEVRKLLRQGLFRF